MVQKRNKEAGERQIVNGEKKNQMPADVDSVLATLYNEPVEGEQWLYEVKWDGFIK